MDKNLIIIIGLAFISMLVFLDNKLLMISKYVIKSNKIPKEFNNYKIVHLSDFHSHTFIGSNNRIIEKIDSEKPDIIVMTGDMVNKYDKKFDRFIDLAQRLSKKYPIYYIVGNHEQRLKKNDFNYIINKIEDFGITILNDEKISVKRKKNHINIYGINIPLRFYRIRNKQLNLEKNINKSLIKCKENEYNILLAHNPLYFEKYANYNVDLVLSGHVHGGMIRLPYVGGLLSPERKFFPKYDSGVYKIKGKNLIVSRGLGHSRPLMRIFNMPEILNITLVNEER